MCIGSMFWSFSLCQETLLSMAFLVFHHESRGRREASREIGYEQCANLRYETSVFDIISGSSIDSLLGPETLIGRQHQSFLVDTTSVQ
jgi:hypothetical protein